MSVSSATNTNTSNTTNTSSSSTQSQPSLGLTSNQFLTLLTTQLQSQDPLNPTDPNQFTSEMVQYAGLSEQIDTNSKLDSLNTTMSSVLAQVSLLAQAGSATATA
jgi:flagellar basal-body rod modification protein FlgD